MSDLDNFLALHFAFIKAKQLAEIEQFFGSLSNALAAKEGDWKGTGLISAKQAERLFDPRRPGLVDLAKNWQETDENHTILTLRNQQYPHLLSEIEDPPILLYVRGQLDWLKAPQVAMVGSRNATQSGEKIAENFADYLSSVGLTITSGLASGIDAAAHRGGLKGCGKTLAVVGTGLDRIYPAANRALAHQIVEQGAIVSEYALGSQPKVHHFPQRNRIISGMATGVLVVEAALKSGSLITAKMALEQGREVFAVPGSIHSPQAKGCHQLIKQGAKLAESGADILEELAPLLNWVLSDADQTQTSLSLEGATSRSDSEDVLLKYMAYEPIGLDELVVVSKMPVSDIQVQLVMLELAGKVVSLSAGRWQRI